MKVLFSLFPGHEKAFKIFTVTGALFCAVLGFFLAEPQSRGPYCVIVLFFLLGLFIAYIMGIKKYRQERLLADRRMLLSWQGSNQKPVKDELYFYILSRLLTAGLLISAAALILILIAVFSNAGKAAILCVPCVYLAILALTGFLQSELKKLFPPNEFALCDHELIHLGACVYINGVTAGIYGVSLDKENNTLHTDLFIKNKTFRIITKVSPSNIEKTVEFIDGLQRHFDSIKKAEEENKHE